MPALSPVSKVGVRSALLSGLSALAFSVLLLPGFVIGAETHTWTATELFEQSVTQDVVLSPAGKIELPSGTLIEDDGPAAGFSYYSNAEKLTAGKLLRKVLVVDRPAARSAQLLVARGGDLQVELNGKKLALGEPEKLGHYWNAYAIDPKLLKQGENAFVISGSGMLWIARDEEYAAGSLTRTHHPNRSARSLDGGKTWDDHSLGDDGGVDGEYNVRLALDQTLPQGKVTTSVIDQGNLGGGGIGPQLTKTGPLEIACQIQKSDQQSVALRIRSSDSPLFTDTEPAWQTVTADLQQKATVDKLAGRYFQLEFTLQTEDPLSSPQLGSLQVSTTAEQVPTTAHWNAEESDNRPLVRSSIPFLHEDFLHPKLKRLREDYQLDEVVAGSESEFELVCRLAAWSHGCWPKLGHLKEVYPSWDASEILKKHTDGTPVGGFCNQFSLVFLQACQSFGVPGRIVSIGPGSRVDLVRGGHETVELWSNQFQKWIYLDGDASCYIRDEETKIPLSLLELRDVQLQSLAGKPARKIKLVSLTETRHSWKDTLGIHPFFEVRMVPRSNFLSQASPVPLNQGMRGWFWTGHAVWSDDQLADRPIYSQRIRKRANFEWTLNRAHLTLEATADPKVVRVFAETETPHLAALDAVIDGAKAMQVEPSFLWTLHEGENCLTVTPRNTADRSGIPCTVVLDFPGN
ncbi:hypothetical protein [Lignipirellula cremea]|uniref:Transglutaminase-like superfamily protein n=1 Tax=Lignipirellula cremea TaxID=2528010 RepID=A0A518DY53_9BACT|nr:hypothetical protein [Lignipirellula cremea]QDU96731.1 hypothetical protein Pla8534_45520 [Lignipirellula cremea]